MLEKKPSFRILLIVAIAVIGFIGGTWQKRVKAAEMVEVNPPFCGLYWSALKLRADGMNEPRAVKIVAEAVSVIFDYKKRGLDLPADSMIPEAELSFG